MLIERKVRDWKRVKVKVSSKPKVKENDRE